MGTKKEHNKYKNIAPVGVKNFLRDRVIRHVYTGNTSKGMQNDSTGKAYEISLDRDETAHHLYHGIYEEHQARYIIWTNISI